MQPHLFGPLLAAALAFATTPALAITITLSGSSSDGTPASVLDAEVTFTDLGGGQLQIDLENTTQPGDEYDINELHFNLDGATVLSMTPVTGWTLNTTASGVDGFGSFEVHLTDGVGGDASQVVPGETQTFILTYSGTLGAGIVEANDQGKTVAAKFVEGPGENAIDECPPFTDACPDEDSAFGSVPEPHVAWILALGLGGLLAVGRSPRRS
jgi:hypothetical protein